MMLAYLDFWEKIHIALEHWGMRLELFHFRPRKRGSLVWRWREFRISSACFCLPREFCRTDQLCLHVQALDKHNWPCCHFNRSSHAAKRPTTCGPSQSPGQQPGQHQLIAPPFGMASADMTMQPPYQTPPNPRKRRLSPTSSGEMAPPSKIRTPEEGQSATPQSGNKKTPRKNIPWTAAEEHLLKTMRDAGTSWGDIAKVWPSPGFEKNEANFWWYDSRFHRDLKVVSKSIGTKICIMPNGKKMKHQRWKKLSKSMMRINGNQLDWNWENLQK